MIHAFIGINGIGDCILELRRIRSELDKIKLLWDTSTIIDLGSSQSLFYITAMAGSLTLTIAVAVEWECAIVSGIVFSSQRGVLDPDTLLFLMYCNEDGEKEITGVVLSRSEVEECLTHSACSFDTSFSGEYLDLDILPGSHSSFVGDTELRRLRLSPGIVKSKVYRKQSVRFHDSVSVILIPRQRRQDFKKQEAIHYSSLDYKRFSREMDDEIEANMRNHRYSKEEAIAALYGPSGDVIHTELNAHVGVSSGAGNATGQLVLSRSPPIPRSISDSALLPHSLELLSEVMTYKEADSLLVHGRQGEGRVDDLSDDEHTTFGRRSISMDDMVDRLAIEEQQLSKQVSWLEQHDREHRVPFRIGDAERVQSGVSTAASPASQKKISAPIPGCLLKRYVPPPRAIHPTVVHISVIACNNLKPSVFWPVVPVNSFVRMTVDGESQYTEVVRRHRNPLYDSSQVYTFVLSCENALHSYISFTVLNKGVTGGDAVLGVTRVAFSALKALPDSSNPTSVILPLHKKINDKMLGRGFWNSDNYDCTVLDYDAKGQELTPQQKSTMPILSVTIAKVDVTLHGMLQRLVQEDEERAARLGPIQWLPTEGTRE